MSPKDVTNTDHVYDGILRFRTITSLLSLLQKASQDAEPRMAISDNPGEERDNLRILGSLATLLVREYEIVAVATSANEDSIRRCREGRTKSSEAIDFVACPTATGSAHRVDTDDGEAAIAYMAEGRSFTAFPNPRRSDGPRSDDILTHMELPTLEPKIIVPEASPIEKGRTLHYYLDNCVNQTFQEHASTVITLVNRYMEACATGNRVTMRPVSRDIEHYIIAVASPKMCSRFSHPSYSIPFMQGLQMAGEHLSTLFPQPSPLSDKQYQLDREFVSLVSNSHVRQFLEALPNVNIEVLVQRKHLYASETTNVSQLATFHDAETCSDFHNLLYALLCDYGGTLFLVRDVRKDIKNAIKQTSLTVERKADFVRRLSRTASRLMMAITVLRSLLNSSALEAHLVHIEHILAHSRAENPSSMAAFGGDAEEEDTELVSVQPSTMDDGAQLSVAASYMRWLRLQMVYFDAIKVICRVAQRMSTNDIATPLSLKVVAVGHQGRQMHKWRDVINSILPDANPMNPNTFTASQAIATLEKLMLENDTMNHALGPNGGLSRGAGFLGTLHSEIGLATALRCPLIPEDIRAELTTVNKKFVGVSKRCCPVCTHLLRILEPGPIHILGSHEQMSPCTLPPWLPDETVDEMVSVFATRLITVLRKTYAQSVVKSHQRSLSANTLPISLPTSESDAGEVFESYREGSLDEDAARAAREDFVNQFQKRSAAP